MIGSGGCIQHNFSSDATYPAQVSLIRQMEYALQTECDESILMGNLEFFKKFAKEYGKDTLRFVRHRANRLLYPHKLKSELEYFKETQDTLLEVVFNKDFENVEDLESAIEYLKKLQGFELVRARIHEKNENQIEEDPTFENFYKSKLRDIERRLLEKGIDEKQIKITLEKYSYRRSEFLPIETEQQQDERIKKMITESIIEHLKSCQEPADKVKEVRAFVAKRKDGEDLILTKAGKPISMILNSKGSYGTISSSKFDFLKYIPRGFSFAQDDNLFYINTAQGREILLEEIELTNIEQQVHEKMKKNEQPKEKKTFMEQMNELKEIASTQCLSVVNRMIRKLRARSEKTEAKPEIRGEEDGRI